MVTPFKYSDYKAFLREVAAAGKPNWGYLTRLAEAAGCQRSYLSRVLNAEVHLIPDHAYNIAVHLNLSETETDYFLNLIELERSSLPTYRQRIESRLSALKQTYENLQTRVNRPPAQNTEKELTYYSSWMFSALHIIASIPRYQTVSAISQRLQIPETLVEQSLVQMQEWGMVRQENKRWVFGGGEIHVSKDSPLSTWHHNNWRQRAILDSQKTPPGSIHFTAVQSMDKAALDSIRHKLLEFIEKSTEAARPAKEELLVCMTLDLFEV